MYHIFTSNYSQQIKIYKIPETEFVILAVDIGVDSNQAEGKWWGIFRCQHMFKVYETEISIPIDIRLVEIKSIVDKCTNEDENILW